MNNLSSTWAIAALIFCLASRPSMALCQPKLSCADLKNGVFHSYPKNTSDHYLSKRDDEFQYETNIVTGDTTTWKINWLNDCTYSLKYISGNNKMTDEVSKLVKKHKFVYEISNLTPDYYIFKGYIDKTSNIAFQTDTMWLTEKAVIPNNEIFKQIPNTSLLKKEHFSDTSKYAVLYVYRPGKLTNSLSNYLIYFNDDIMCVGKNNTGYIFKIMKEGRFELKSKLYKDESSIKIDLKFGKVYYVKSMVHWGFFKGMKNFKLEMENVNAEVGKTEFDALKFQ